MAQKNVLKYIILGLLAQQELAGYDIKKLFEGELGDFWYSNHSQIYPELQRMETGGIIDSFSKTIGQKLEKKFYRITDSGKALLREWLQEPLGDVAPTRDEFTMKLYLIQDAADPLIPELFAEEIARHEEKYQYLQARWQQGQWWIGPDAFFFEEGTAAQYEQARYGEFRLQPDGATLLVGLRDQALKPIGHTRPAW